MKSQCGNGHDWAGNEAWRSVTKNGKQVNRRYCLACKRDWNKRKYEHRASMKLKYAREWQTPSLEVGVIKPTLDVMLAGNVRYRIYPCATEGV